MERKYGAKLMDLLYPRRCPACHEVVSRRGELICPECRGRFQSVEEPVCLKCGKGLRFAEEEYCFQCREHPKAFTASTAVFYYDETAQASMMKFKYEGRREYADYYVEALLQQRKERILRWRPQLILPVPIHRSRRRERGFNQAEELAKRLSQALNIPLRTDILLRTRKTTDQKELNAAARQQNLQQALTVAVPLTGLKRVLLVDDIYTTGSTLQACTRALQAAGAHQVYGCTIFIGGHD